MCKIGAKGGGVDEEIIIITKKLGNLSRNKKKEDLRASQESTRCSPSQVQGVKSVNFSSRSSGTPAWQEFPKEPLSQFPSGLGVKEASTQSFKKGVEARQYAREMGMH